MSVNDKYPSANFGDSSQLTNWILDSGETCHMTSEVSGCTTSSLEDMDKYIDVTDRYHVTTKQKGQVQIKMRNNNEDPFIATLHNIL